MVNPISDTIVSKNLPEKYMIKHSNQFEYQDKNDCGGYAAAFILRNTGKKTKGEEVFEQFEHTSSRGVLESYLVKYLRSQKMNTNLYYGNIDTLKTRIAEGHPK